MIKLFIFLSSQDRMIQEYLLLLFPTLLHQSKKKRNEILTEVEIVNVYLLNFESYLPLTLEVSFMHLLKNLNSFKSHFMHKKFHYLQSAGCYTFANTEQY